MTMGKDKIHRSFALVLHITEVKVYYLASFFKWHYLKGHKMDPPMEETGKGLEAWDFSAMH